MLGPLLKVQVWFVWQAQGIQKSDPKREGFVGCPKTMAGVGRLKRIWKDAFHLPERGSILEHQIFRFAKIDRQMDT